MEKKAFVINALRRASVKWPARTEIKRLARVERGKYLCAGCGSIARAKDVSVDHVEPCIDPEKGFEDWNTYIDRLFCPALNLQVLCKECHDTKSKAENERRRDAKPKKAPKKR